MLKLVQCEFAKLKRKKIIPLVFLSAFLFPIPITFLMATPRMLEKYPNKSVLFDGLFNMVMGYGVIFPQIASANWTPVGRNLIFIAMVLVGASDSTKTMAAAADQAA